ncbi:MAG: hypothetical protein HYT80_09355 [Euryarchaeota archaeon]|nr:hypothetical protein [Euryarchaeota archaeon]
MTLEDESLKERGVDPRSLRRPAGVAGLARAIAFLILLAGLSAIYWIPFQFLGPIGAAVVVAALTLLGASLASRLHRLRQRLDELESRAATAPPPPAEPPALHQK